MKADLFHLIVYTPREAANRVRRALSDAGAGNIGNYKSCSFSMQGTGRFMPTKGAHPALGSPGTLEEVEEERIEVVVPAEKLKDVLQAVKNIHPYEEPAMHVLPMVDYHDYLIDV